MNWTNFTIVVSQRTEMPQEREKENLLVEQSNHIHLSIIFMVFFLGGIPGAPKQLLIQ